MYHKVYKFCICKGPGDRAQPRGALSSHGTSCCEKGLERGGRGGTGLLDFLPAWGLFLRCMLGTCPGTGEKDWEGPGVPTPDVEASSPGLA